MNLHTDCCGDNTPPRMFSDSGRGIYLSSFFFFFSSFNNNSIAEENSLGASKNY